MVVDQENQLNSTADFRQTSAQYKQPFCPAGDAASQNGRVHNGKQPDTPTGDAASRNGRVHSALPPANQNSCNNNNSITWCVGDATSALSGGERVKCVTFSEDKTTRTEAGNKTKIR